MGNTIVRPGEDDGGDQHGGRQLHGSCVCCQIQQDQRSGWQMLVDAESVVRIVVDVAQMIFG